MRDIIKEDFGRQTRLFEALSKYDNSITFFCVDYKKKEEYDTKLHGMDILIRPFNYFNPASVLVFCLRLYKEIKKGKYDLVIGTSDPLWGVFGYYLSKWNNVPFLYDLHDNYEVYQSYSLPLFRYLDHHIIRKSAIVTTVSETLKEYLAPIREKDLFVVPNGVDLELFRLKSKAAARANLHIPKQAKVIAYAGTLQRLQGIYILIEAFRRLKASFPQLMLLLAGRVKKVKGEELDLEVDGLVHRDDLNQRQVVDVINAADVVVIPNSDNSFTRYCFPYKCVEYMACNTPIVATDVGDVGRMLEGFPGSLCRPDDVEDMVEKIAKKLRNPKKADYRSKVIQKSWLRIANMLDNVIKKVINKN